MTQNASFTEQTTHSASAAACIAINTAAIWNAIELFVTVHSGLGNVPHLTDLFVRDLGTRPIWRLAHEHTRISLQCVGYFWFRCLLAFLFTLSVSGTCCFVSLNLIYFFAPFYSIQLPKFWSELQGHWFIWLNSGNSILSSAEIRLCEASKVFSHSVSQMFDQLILLL
jgi:hypothetical protein